MYQRAFRGYALRHKLTSLISNIVNSNRLGSIEGVNDVPKALKWHELISSSVETEARDDFTTEKKKSSVGELNFLSILD